MNKSVRLPDAQVISRYKVGQSSVTITSDGRYIVHEPALTFEGEKIYREMLMYMYQSLMPLKDSRDPVAYIEENIWRRASLIGQTDKIKKCYRGLRYRLERDILRYGILDVPMQDSQVEDITCERFDMDVGIVHRVYKSWKHPVLDTNLSFGTKNNMNAFVQSIMLRNHKTVSDAKPFGNLRLPEGHRMHITYDDKVSLPGPIISIRKFTKVPLTVIDLIKNGTMTKLQAAYLWMMIDARAFGILVGPTSAGKTTVLNALMFLCHPKWIIVTAEDIPELQIPHKRWKRLVTREDYENEKFAINLQRLNYEALRMRPHFVVLGEARNSGEVHSLFDIAATGHGGMATFHAEDPAYARMRLTDRDIGLSRNQLVLLWFMVHLGEIRHGKEIRRKILRIDEITPGSNSPKIEPLFKYMVSDDRYDTECVEDLVAKSKRVHDVAKKFGTDASKNLTKRINLLERCTQEKISSPADIIKILGSIYL